MVGMAAYHNDDRHMYDCHIDSLARASTVLRVLNAPIRRGRNGSSSSYR
jgi:hypothetical protein